MIFKIMPPSTSFHGVDYSEKKKEQGTGALVHFENFGYLQERSQVSKNDIKEFFKKHSASNNRVKKPQFHAILSCKGQESTYEQLKENALKIMEELGYKNQPILIYQHSDTKNNHVHIVTSRVDSSGKKISDKFEGMRANKIMNEMLSIDTKEEYKKTLEAISGYRITTASQFILLLEKQGYTCKRGGEGFVLFKHGHKQGSVTNTQIEKQVQQSSLLSINNGEIKAAIEKYKEQYSPDLIGQTVSNKPTGKRVFSSHLTDYLHKSHGLEFVFFGTISHEKPYGYVIIDHNHKAVIKGSEVMKLDYLIGRSPVEKGSHNYTSAGTGHTQAINIYTPNNPKHQEGPEQKDINRASHSFLNEELLQSLDLVIDEAMRENESSGLTMKRKKARKKNLSH